MDARANGRGRDGRGRDRARETGRQSEAKRRAEQDRKIFSKCFLQEAVDLYPSIVLLAWSLARSDEIDLSAIAVKREILQFVIEYCSLDL